jgi:multidrug efflux pump subunit AcrA (membrane-fusion protein)
MRKTTSSLSWKLLFLVLVALSLPSFARSSNVMNLFGTLEYKRHQLVLANFDGVVKKLHVTSGEYVKKNQPLIEVLALDPGLNEQISFFAYDGYKISNINVSEGDRVSRYQTLLRLDNKADLIVKAIVYHPSTARLKLEQQVQVILDPDNLNFLIAGNIEAIYQSNAEIGELPHNILDIRINPLAKNCSEECSSYLTKGTIVKVKIRFNDS